MIHNVSQILEVACALQRTCRVIELLSIFKLPRARESLRMTLNNRLATAAPAIVVRMISRRRPRVFLPVFPFKKGSRAAATIFDAAKYVIELSPSIKEQIVILHKLFSGAASPDSLRTS